MLSLTYVFIHLSINWQWDWYIINIVSDAARNTEVQMPSGYVMFFPLDVYPVERGMLKEVFCQYYVQNILLS